MRYPLRLWSCVRVTSDVCWGRNANAMACYM